MAKLGFEFDADTVEERQDYTPVPAGSYVMMFVESETKETSTGGEMIVLTSEVQDEQFKGRKIFTRLNVKNANEKAVEIAFRELGEIVKAVGKTKIKDTEELHNIRFVADVAVEKGKPYMKDGVQVEGKPNNVIKKYKKYGTQTEAAAPVSTARPWAKKA